MPGVNYLHLAGWIVDLLSRLKSIGSRFEEEQAGYVKRYCEMLNRAGIDGYFYTQFSDSVYFDNGYGLCNGTKRKKGFYMYKSYQRTS